MSEKSIPNNFVFTRPWVKLKKFIYFPFEFTVYAKLISSLSAVGICQRNQWIALSYIIFDIDVGILYFS